MSKALWVVTYKAMADGREITIKCASQKEAEAFKKWITRVDPNAEPVVHQLD